MTNGREIGSVFTVYAGYPIWNLDSGITKLPLAPFTRFKWYT